MRTHRCSRRFLHDYTGSKTLGWQLLDDDAGWEHPLVARCFPEALREGAVGLRRDREWLLRVMEPGAPRRLYECISRRISALQGRRLASRIAPALAD